MYHIFIDEWPLPFCLFLIFCLFTSFTHLTRLPLLSIYIQAGVRHRPVQLITVETNDCVPLTLFPQNRPVYMFRIDAEHILDATITGGLAR